MLFTVSSASAQSSLEKADRLTSLGAYREAETAYAAMEQTVPILLRRLAVAQLVEDSGAVEKLASQIEEKNPDTLAQLRVAMARADQAYRLGQTAKSRKYFGQAESLMSKARGQELGCLRFILESYRYLDDTYWKGRPAPAAYASKFQELVGRIDLQPNLRYPAGDMLQVGSWVRFWIYTAYEYADQTGAADAQTGAAWLQAAGQITQSIYPPLLARAQALPYDPEAGYAAQHTLVEFVFTFWAYPATAPLVDQIRQTLEIGDKILADHWNKTLGGTYDYEEQKTLWARYHQARARTLALAQRHEEALAAYRMALAGYRQTGQALMAVDVMQEAAFHQILTHPPGWQLVSQEMLEAALAESTRLHYLVGRCFALGRMGWRASLMNDLPGAEKNYRQAIAQVAEWLGESGASSQGRREFMARSRPLFDGLIEVLLRQEKKAEAAEIGQLQQRLHTAAEVDLSKIGALKEVEEAKVRRRELTDQLQTAQSRGDQARVRQLTGQLAKNKEEFYRALNELRKTNPEYERLLSLRPTSFSKLQPLLPEGTLLVQYCLTQDKLYLFVATREDLKIHSLAVSAADIEKSVRRVRQGLTAFLGDPGRLDSKTEAALRQLYGQLIAPLESDLAKAKLLAVAPSGPLFYLPFAALTSDSGKYLIEEKPLVILTSLEVLDQKPSGSKPASILAIGNPDGSLPAASQEATELAALFPNNQLYLHNNATKDKLSNVNSSIVHLATHGHLNPTDVNESYLLMAGGKLTTGDIYGLKLDGVDLVTLSACQTALADKPTSAEIPSLAQAFSVAGSHSLIASLWSVEDEATRRLMLEFYQQLLAGNSRAESLRTAQISMIRSGSSHPFLWAAFQLIGGWR